MLGRVASAAVMMLAAPARRGGGDGVSRVLLVLLAAIALAGGATAPCSCAWDTVAAGDRSYDLRAVATDSANYSRTASRSARVVDNLAPTVSLTNPGAYLSGTKTITATAS